MTDTAAAQDEFASRDDADATSLAEASGGISLADFWAMLDPIPDEARP